MTMVSKNRIVWFQMISATRACTHWRWKDKE